VLNNLPGTGAIWSRGIFMTLTIEVPDDLAEQIAAWEDGKNYELEVTQTGEGAFTLNSAEASEEPAESSSMQEMAYKAAEGE
jgi:hypothetical protein